MSKSSVRPSRREAILPFLILLGTYLTVRGYHSRDGDQAYRLPLLLHRQDPTLYASDPFVRAFDAFNPHRAYLALLDWASRPLGLSAALFGLFVLTFAATAAGIDRLARAVWPEAGPRVGLVAVGLLLVDRAGNVGTNHLFDGMLLDRLIGFGLGWIALGSAVSRPGRRPWFGAAAIGLAALVHPSIGLQLAMLLGVAWAAWWVWSSRTGVGWREAASGVGLLALALVPAALLHGGSGSRMFDGLSREDFLLLSAHVQSPQHMLPHLWRRPQWLAWGSAIGLAALALLRGGPWPAARVRVVLLLGVNLVGLGLAWVAIEGMHDPRATLFQPFRMATIARGLAMAILAGHVRALWGLGNVEGKLRATFLAVGLTGDWTLVVVAAADVATATAEWVRPAWSRRTGLIVLAIGLAFLARHDTESGHLRIGLAAIVLTAWLLAARRRTDVWTVKRLAWVTALSWAVPIAAMAAPAVLKVEHGWGRGVAVTLAGRCRFGEVPLGDLERLAIWCRGHTPATARFIGPPGQKTFRLWSRREVAFNRAGSPYHAAGLADWSARFRDHVGFRGSTADFARAYLADRQQLESNYRTMSAADLAGLATRQGASHVLSSYRAGLNGPLELLCVEGTYAVYRVRQAVPGTPQARIAPGTRSAPSRSLARAEPSRR